ncbi:MAG: hypothetical protein ACERKN_15990 [Velocimicrobium sp.]
MKRAFIYIGVMFVAAITLSTAYYVSYKKTLEQYQNPTTKVPPIEADLAQTPDTAKVDTITEDLITSKTNFTLITNDLQTNSYQEESKLIPSDWIGLNRQDLISYLADYMNNLPLSEIKNGLKSYDLQSFSSDLIVLIKSYDEASMPYEYYVTVINYEIIVYYCDKKTIFEYTGIDARNLSTAEQNKLIEGIYVLDKEELYGMLENYSS